MCGYRLYGLFFFSSRRRHTRWPRDWSSDVCSSDLANAPPFAGGQAPQGTTSGGRPRARGPWRAVGAATPSPSRWGLQIGRASWRERVWIAGGGGAVKRKEGGGRAARPESRASSAVL